MIFTDFSDASGISGSVYSFLSLYPLFVSSRDKTKNQVTWETSLKRTRMDIPAVTSSAVPTSERERKVAANIACVNAR